VSLSRHRSCTFCTRRSALLLTPQNCSRYKSSRWPRDSESHIGGERQHAVAISQALFVLDQAYQIREHADQGEKADPCQAEHGGTAILLVVGYDRLTNHNHERLPRFGLAILDPFRCRKNEHSVPHCTNPSLL
jgi:hypothetical protein